MTAAMSSAPTSASEDPAEGEHRRHRFFSPYALAVTLSLLALSPFIVLTVATESLTGLIGHDLHASETTLAIGAGFANAGYALGAVVAAALAQRLVQRRLFLTYEAIFIAASLLAALAPDAAVFLVGRVLEGAATGLLLVGALPPLILRFPAVRMPLTVAFVNVGLFGAIALGPFLGSVFEQAGTWRWLFAAAAVLGAFGWVAGYFGYEVFPPFNPDLKTDIPVFPLAVGATFLPFLGSALVAKVGFTGALFWAPVAVGVALLVGMIVYEYHHRGEPLMPVRALSSSLPVAGTLGAMLGGGAFVAALSLTTQLLAQRHVPVLRSGVYLLPLVVGVAASSLLFKRYIVRAGLPYLAVSGLLAVAAGVGVLLPVTWSADPAWAVPVAAVLLGFGAGSAVAPALFLAGLGVDAQKIGRAFALIELLRSEAAFIMAPVLLVLAAHVGGLTGLRESLLVSLGIAALGAIVFAAVYVGSGTRRHAPDLAGWLEDGKQGLHSPRVFALPRGLSVDD